MPENPEESRTPKWIPVTDTRQITHAIMKWAKQVEVYFPPILHLEGRRIQIRRRSFQLMGALKKELSGLWQPGNRPGRVWRLQTDTVERRALELFRDSRTALRRLQGTGRPGKTAVQLAKELLSFVKHGGHSQVEYVRGKKTFIQFRMSPYKLIDPSDGQEYVFPALQISLKATLDSDSLRTLQVTAPVALRNTAQGRSHYHPHVDTRGDICRGDATELLSNLTKELEVGAICTAIDSLLATYNPESPFIRLAEWNGQACENCDSTEHRQDSMYEHEGGYYCGDCVAGDCSETGRIIFRGEGIEYQGHLYHESLLMGGTEEGAPVLERVNAHLFWRAPDCNYYVSFVDTRLVYRETGARERALSSDTCRCHVLQAPVLVSEAEFDEATEQYTAVWLAELSAEERDAWKTEHNILGFDLSDLENFVPRAQEGETVFEYALRRANHQVFQHAQARKPREDLPGYFYLRNIAHFEEEYPGLLDHLYETSSTADTEPADPPATEPAETTRHRAHRAATSHMLEREAWLVTRANASGAPSYVYRGYIAHCHTGAQTLQILPVRSDLSRYEVASQEHQAYESSPLREYRIRLESWYHHNTDNPFLSEETNNSAATGYTDLQSTLTLPLGG